MRPPFFAAAVLVAALLPRPAGAEPLDLARYMPASEVQAGMTGIGKTTLEGTDIVEFQVRVMAVLKNSGPKRDLIVIRCSGAGLEESGVIAGMSGSPVYINGRLIGAVAYAFQWGKLPLAGVQPIQQMLEVTDERPWTSRGPRPIADARPGAGLLRGTGATLPESGISDLISQISNPASQISNSASQISDFTSQISDSRPPAAGAPAGAAGAAGWAAGGGPGFLVPASALDPADAAGAPPGREAFDFLPIQTPVMLSGLSPRVLERFRQDLAPYGLVPMMSGGFDPDRPVKARLEPGAPLAVCMMRGDASATGMGTVTEIVGDRLYGFGHAMFGFGEADYPLMTGVAKVVVPSLMRSVRIGAPVAEVGRLAWDEQTAVFGRLSKDRAAMVPISVRITGPVKGAVRSYRYEVIRHPTMSPMLAAMAVGNSLVVQADLPRDHTVAYRVAVKPVGRPPVVRENLAVSPGADMYLEAQVRTVLALAMDNPFCNVPVESIEVEAAIEAESRLAEIQEVRALRNAVRPGGTMPVEIKVRPWRAEPKWMRVDVPVPADYPDGTFRATLCGADEALRGEMRDAPARFRAEDLDSLLAILGRSERRDQLFIRLDAPGDGLAIGRDELPNLPATMRAVLAGSARRQVSGVSQPRVSRQPVPYVLQGSGDVTITVDRHAPEP
ncbi:MAG: hypothetical protein IMZ44_17160 [Planctomycetes bacterium]|nr:hypothetical protein [Planctomycetota bacterium]